MSKIKIKTEDIKYRKLPVRPSSKHKSKKTYSRKQRDDYEKD